MSKKYILYALSLVSSSQLYAEGLSQEANDPTAPLMAVQLKDDYVLGFHNGMENKTANSMMLRTAYPYRWGKTNHIARITQPYTTDTPLGDTGIGDMTLFDLLVFSESWGRYGVGVVGTLPLSDKSKQWSIGPSFGFVNNTVKEGLNVGLFNQNLFRIAGDDGRPYTRMSSLQPILNYSLQDGWNIGTGDIQYIYDWESKQWISLPVALQIGKLVRLGTVPTIFFLQYQYNFADKVHTESGLYAPVVKNSLSFTVKFLFPTR